MALIPLEEYLQQRMEEISKSLPFPQIQPGPAPSEQPGFITGPFERGLRGAQSDLTAAAGLVAQSLGFDEISQGIYDKAKEYAAARDAIPRRVPRMEDIQGLGDLGIFAVETLVENAPLLATIAIPGGVAAKAASIVGAGARAAQATGVVASFLTDVGLQTGESAQIARDAGHDPADIRVLGSGIGKGILDFVPMLTVAKRMGLLKGLPLGPVIEREISKYLVNRGFIGRVAGEMGTIAAREVPTEVAQEAMNIALDRSLNQFHGALTEDEVSQLKNAAAGAAAFSLLGIPAAVMGPRAEQAPPPDPKKEVDKLQQGSSRMIDDDEIGRFEGEGGGQPPPPPRALRISPDGQIQDYPIDKWEDEGGPGMSLQIPPTLAPESPNDLRKAIAQQMAKAPTPEPAVLFGEGTSRTSQGPEALDILAKQSLATPAQWRSYVDNAVIMVNGAVQNGKPRQSIVPSTPHPVDPSQGLADTLKPLMAVRDDILSNQELRTKTGQLNAAGKKQLAAVEARIARSAELSGITNPVPKGLEDSKDIEADLEKFNADSVKPMGNLSEGEIEYINQLEQKEVTNGLTDEEESTLNKLYLKRVARPKVVRPRRLTAHEIRSLAEAPPVTVQEGPAGEDFLSSGVPEGVLRSQQKEKVFPDAYLSLDDNIKLRGLKQMNQTAEVEQQQRELIQKAEMKRNFEKKKGVEEKPKYSVQQVAQWVKELSSAFPRMPDFIVAPSTKMFRGVKGREHLVDEWDRTEGMFFQNEPNTIYIFSDRIKSKRDLGKLLLHEMFHLGFHNYMTAQEKSQFLQMMLAAKGELIMNRVADYHPELSTARAANAYDPQVQAKLQEAMLIQAEEVLAVEAENNPKDSLIDRIAAFFARVVRRLFPDLKITMPEIRVLIRDVGAWSRNKSAVTERNYRQVSEPFRKREFSRLIGRQGLHEAETMPGIHQWGEVWGQKFLNGVLTPLQMANSAFVKKYLPSAPLYLDFVQQWWARKRNLTNTAVEIADQWTKMSKRDAERLGRTIFEVSIESDEKGERLTDAEVKAIMKKNGMDPDEIPTLGGVQTGSRNLFQMWRDVDNSFRQIVDDMEKGIQVSVIRQAIRKPGEIANPIRDRARADELAKKWRASPDHKEFFADVVNSPDLVNLNLGGRLLEIENQMQQLRGKNYFPRMRFGKYAITVRAATDMMYHGQAVKKDEVVWFETHEGPKSQGERLAELRSGEFSDTKLFKTPQDTRLSDKEFVFLGMPPALYETLRSELGLSDQQQEALKEIYRKFSPGSAFLRHLIRRKDIAGFSTDAIRIYASYITNAANHLARVEYHLDLGDSLNNIRIESNQPVNATRAGEVREYFAKHFEYIMNPGNDWARLRSLGFLWYLGFNVKSALVNLTQIPMVAYPFLASRYGDKSAIAAISKATTDVTKMRRGRKVLDVEADRDLARALQDGFIDESRATELAGLAEGDILQRLMPEGPSAKVINKASYFGAFLFRHAEKVNREIVFLAARELALQRGLKGEQVYRAAREAVQTTMFEYAKWNRPEYTRGKKSVFFLFTNYVQHLSYLAYGGEGAKVAVRLWLGLMMAAGAQGLPFAENFFDIFDWSATTIKEMAGVEDPRTAIREDIRELANTITDQPDLIMHGLGRYYGLGPMHFLSLFDVPVPNVDISSSLSAGEIIPGLREALAANEDPDAKLGKVLIDAMGPVVGIGYNLWRASADDNPDTWKTWERAMPSAISSVSKAFRRSKEGGETLRGGGKLIEFEPQNMEHRMENVAQALGFGPTRLAQRQELRYSQEQLKQYWTGRRAALMESYAYALLARDQEAVDFARKKIREFNKAVPSKVLAIQSDSLTASIRERYRRRTLREAGIPAENAFRPLYRQTEQRFQEGAAAIPGRSQYPPQ